VESVQPIGGPSGTGFGSALSADGNKWAVGAPLYNATGFGAVFSSARNDAGEWNILPLLVGELDGDDYGAALDLSGNQLIVGAPMRPIVDTTTPAGAAYVYSFNPSNGGWEQRGLALRSGSDILDANGEFGAAVAVGLGTAPRVVVGAPKNNPNTETLEAGRVYTFQAADTEWSALETAPIVGKAASDWFGASVDMTSDGSRFIAGAPGNSAESTGYFQIFEWTDTQWILQYEEVGSAGEAFGTSVVSLSDNGDLFAVGGPGYSQGSGRIAVYQRQSSGDYAQLGGPIVGAPGDRIGSRGLVAGGLFEEEPILTVGTASGRVKSFILNSASSTWSERFEVLQASNDSSAVIQYTDDIGLLTVDGTSEELSIYEALATVSSTSAPTMTPAAVESPIPAPVGSPVSEPQVTAPPNATVPTEPPTGMNATIAPIEIWALTGSSFTPNTDGSGFGASVSVASWTMAVGAPQTLSNGAVFVYQKVSGVWETTASGQLFGSEAGGQFGAAVDVADGFLIAGSPNMYATGTTTSVGAAFVYAYTNGQWSQLGATLRGDAGVYGTGERFGASVSAASSVRRVVVGAPDSSYDIIASRGRIYVYEFSADTSSWALMLDVPGLAANYALGTSVDMSLDGSQLAVGAPGGGYAELYEYNGTSWASAYVAQGAVGFGSAVAMLAPSILAVGEPAANNGQGRIVVYQGLDGVFQQLGPSIDGQAGDQLGATGKVSGGSDTDRSTVVVGTANGAIKRFDYDAASNVWVQRGNTVDTGFGTGLTGVASSSRAQSFVAGGPLNAVIYELL
jgi:hypothetical protein